MISPQSLARGIALLGVASLANATPCEIAPKLGAVASESDICSKVGTELLQKGGNAVDAAVGTVFCVGTVAMYHSGLGGGGFMVVRSSEGEYEFVDFREKAPAAAFQDMYKEDPDLSLYGGLASGVPGELRGTEYAHKKYGALSWKEVIAPSIELARYGWTVNEDLVRYMDSVSDDPFLTDDPSWALDFAPNGYRVKLGETITRKRYANTLETIAEEGADAFYGGAIGNATVAALAAEDGIMTLQDLRDYEVAQREPVSIDYRGYKLTSSNAPSSGVVALSVLNTVNGYEGFDDPAQVNLSTHRLDEAMRFAYGQRTELGDPSFVEGLEEYTLDMISAENGENIRSKISDVRTYNLEYYNPDGLEVLDTPGTAHIATADASGMAVSLTTTVNLLFGSKVIVPETGVIMNNEMNDFSIPGVTNSFGFLPSPANFVRPGKRPLSSISPIIAETPDGRLLFAVGAAGGSRIITSSLLSAMHMIDMDMSVVEALAEPRLHDQLSPTETTFEYAFNNETVAFMEEIGHNVSWVAPGQSAAQGVALLPNGTFEAAGEPRQKNSGGFAV